MEGNTLPPVPNNDELNAAIKEFEAKQSTQQVQKVEEDAKAAELPRMVRMIIKLSGGAIKDELQAGYVLGAFAVMAFLISLYFWGVI